MARPSSTMYPIAGAAATLILLLGQKYKFLSGNLNLAINWLSFYIIFCGLIVKMTNHWNHISSNNIPPVTESHQCRIYQRYNKDIGFGAFAGQNYTEEDLLEVAAGIPVALKHVKLSALDDYVSGFNETHGIADLGFGMVWNHQPLSSGACSVGKFSPTGTPEFLFPDGSASEDLEYRATRNISVGEELLSFFGDDWFSSRHVEELIPMHDNTIGAPTFFDESKSIRVRGCPHSMVSYKNQRLYAAREIKENEYIEVSRALLIPASHYENAGPIETMVWRSQPSDDYTVHDESLAFLLGYGLLYREAGEGQAPTVEYSWLDLDSSREHENSDGNGGWGYMPTKEAGLCISRMVVGFRAKRDIKVDEELTVALRVDRTTSHRFISDPTFPTDCLLGRAAEECPLYTRYHPEIGFGVFAGINYEKGKILQTSMGIPIPHGMSDHNELSYFISGLNQTHELLDLGYAMIYNHKPRTDGRYDVGKYQVHDPPLLVFMDGSESVDVAYTAEHDIVEGQEILSFFGDNWFTFRNETEHTSIGMAPLREAPRVPGCPAASLIVRRFGLFAARSFKAGEYVEITRTLLLPSSKVRGAGPIESLSWYSDNGHSHNDSSLVVVPLGYGLLYGESSAVEEANVEYVWMDHADAATQFIPDKSAGDCRSRMILGFRAKRDIVILEKLSVALRVEESESSNNVRRYINDPAFSLDCLF